MLRLKNSFAVVVAFAICHLGTTLVAQELSREELNFFESKIRPVLVKDCYGCHSAKTGASKGGLMVDTKASLLIGGDSGAAIVPGELDESLLWSAINHEDYNMPPGKMLSKKVIADFETWIQMGAPDPRVMKISEIKSKITPQDIEKGREFWAFKKPVKPATPSVKDSRWAETDIDRFVLAKLESNQLRPAKDASPETVLRRLTFRLTGLPPTFQQIQRVQNSDAGNLTQVIEEIVDELLDSEQFGERWARHWLDIARYGESSGREINITFPNAWRYRDFVIDSFNDDKPYNEFVQQQIAGDLLPVDSDEQWAENLVATGFLAIGPKTLAEQNGRQFRLDLIDEQVDVTSRSILGVSVACARCHDHKFDPIPQADYYAMSGIFENTSTHYGTIDTLQNRRPSNLIMLPVDDPKIQSKKLTKKQRQALEDELAETQEQFREAIRARQRMKNSDSSNNEAGKSQFNVARLSSKSAALEAKLASYDSDGNPLTYAMGAQELETLVETRLLDRGEFDQRGQVVPRGFPQVLCEQPITTDKESSGRLQLARWISSEENPLTARVMVNRIWQHMMGQAIVRTPENFGATGEPPTHPELLDWLAIRFVENNWSVKTLIREIAVSHVFRSASDFDSAAFQHDPTNELLWRFEPKRLDAESLRDSILAISGQLDRKRPYGSLVAAAGDGLVRDGTVLSLASQSNQGQTRKAIGGGQNMMQRLRTNVGETMMARAGGAMTRLDQSLNYRSVYLPIVRDNVARSLAVFDVAESTMVVGTRETSNTPDQGLYFLNNDFVIQQSELFAETLTSRHKDVDDQLRHAFLLAYGRDATKEELSAAREFYETFEVAGGEFQRGRQQAALNKLSALCQAILASAEFRILN